MTADRPGGAGIAPPTRGSHAAMSGRIRRWQWALVALVGLLGWIPLTFLAAALVCETSGASLDKACAGAAAGAGILLAGFLRRAGRSLGAACLLGAGFAAATFVLLGIAVIGNMGALDRGKQKRTIADIRSLATALEGLRAADGYPAGLDAESLASRIGGKPAPPLDGWGFPIEVRVRSDRYVIRSSAMCGCFETPDPWAVLPADAARRRYEDDIVFDTGRFTAHPEGTQR